MVYSPGSGRRTPGLIARPAATSRPRSVVRDRLEDWLREFRDGRMELNDVMTRLDAQFADQGVDLPSRSAVHRHSQQLLLLDQALIGQPDDFGLDLVVCGDLATGADQVADHGAGQRILRRILQLAQDGQAQIGGEVVDVSHLARTPASRK